MADRRPGWSPDAIVLGARYSALGIVQSLGSKGLCVEVYHERPGIAGRSRWGGFTEAPHPFHERDAWLAKLRRICEGCTSPPVIIPTADPEASALAESIPELLDVAFIRTPSAEATETVLDKGTFGVWSETHGFSAPPSIIASDLARSGASVEYPLVAKPRFRRARGSRSPNAIQRLDILEGPSDWARFRHQYASRLGDIVLQGFVPGDTSDMYSVGVCGDRGRIHAMFVGHKVRGYPALFGDTIVGESAELPEHVIDEVRRICDALAIDGLAEVEYKRDRATGEFRLIEINPRAWSWIAATIPDGSDLPAAVWTLASGAALSRGDPTRPESAAVRYVRVIPDFANVCLRYKHDHSAWARGPLAWRRELKESPSLIAERHLGDNSILWWGLRRAVQQELESWPSKPVMVETATVARDLVQTGLQWSVAWFTPQKWWRRIATSIARGRARFDSGYPLRVQHLERVIGGDARVATDPSDLEILRSASVFLDGVATFRELRPGRWSPDIHIHDAAHLEAALAGGKGAILWIANVSESRLLLRRALSRIAPGFVQLSRPSHGFSSTTFGRRMLNPLWRRAEDRYLGKRILIEERDPKSATAPLRELRRHLKGNGVVSITVGDEAQDVGYIPFFGSELGLATGPIKLGLASGAPVIPVFAAPNEDGFHVWIEPPLETPAGSDVSGMLASYGERFVEHAAAHPHVQRMWGQALAAEA